MFLVAVMFLAVLSVDSSIRVIDDCQLLIVGGSTAALGAALSASKFLGQRICLLEPTDWAGGQLTSELLSAPDFAGQTLRDGNFTLNVGFINRQLENRNPLFTQMLDVLGNTGHCRVSPTCSIPDQFHSRAVLPLLENIRIFYNTVIKHVDKDASTRRIIKIDAIQRTPIATAPKCRFLSEELPDWYSYENSAWFEKSPLSFTNFSFVVEGSSWGEVLVLANASYLQGLMEKFDGDTSGDGNCSCGQALTFDFLEQLRETPVDEPPNPLPEPSGGGRYTLGGEPWEQVWTYRRANTSVLDTKTVAINDTIIQNFGGGNDFSAEFFFLSPADAQRQRDNNQWQGGVNLNAIRGGEEKAYGWHYWYRAHAPTEWANRTVLVKSPAWTGTCHGLGKLPYIRESRRSIGVQNFLMNISAINGSALNLHGPIFYDRMCLGAYNVDIHLMWSCEYPKYITESFSSLPYYVPLRAMTNRDIDNLMVIGKTMAQTFLANAAVRLHPVEFSSGQAGGVAIAYATINNLQSVAEMLNEEHLARVQSLVKIFTPMSWTINGTRYPDD